MLFLFRTYTIKAAQSSISIPLFTPLLYFRLQCAWTIEKLFFFRSTYNRMRFFFSSLFVWFCFNWISYEWLVSIGQQKGKVIEVLWYFSSMRDWKWTLHKLFNIINNLHSCESDFALAKKKKKTRKKITQTIE